MNIRENVEMLKDFIIFLNLIVKKKRYIASKKEKSTLLFALMKSLFRDAGIDRVSKRDIKVTAVRGLSSRKLRSSNVKRVNRLREF